MEQAPDLFEIDDLLTEEHRQIRASVRSFVESEIKPIINKAAKEEKFPIELMEKMGSLGVLGPTIPEKYGSLGLDYTSYGIMMQEIERGDSGIRSAASVQGSLVMYPIFAFGSEKQKQTFLPDLASGKKIGCFGLTEPNHGSNPGGMETKILKKSSKYVLNGAKTWISNAPIADLAIVWAKNDEGKVQGLIVEKGMPGFSTSEIKNKWSLLASSTGELIFDSVEIPEENILPEAKGLKAALSCLDKARYGISWGAIGAAIDCYQTAKIYALERIQFDKPIAQFQLTQKKLAEMLTEITKAQLVSWRLGKLMDENKANSTQISLAKRNNVAMALNIARESRQILGANGISGDFPIMRHLMNLESVITYEGTHDIHLLILGQYITGISAFKF